MNIVLAVPFYETEWFNVILMALAVGFAGLITFAFTLFNKWLSSKIKNAELREAMQAASKALENAVLSVQQTFVEQLKKDGKFDADAQKEALNLALDRAVAMLSDEMLDLLTNTFGDVNNWLFAQAEAIIAMLKR